MITPSACLLSSISIRNFYTDNSIVAFKIDSCVLLDHNGAEYDLAVLVVAKDTEKSKVCSDRAKIFQEAKDITNTLAKILPDDDRFLKNTYSFGI
ncbi:hypothetical protein BGX27_007926 [Mortierella sp. AM989]|nr:hypothetical protein BGX27_007926 [Mortierella sp. AM989]